MIRIRRFHLLADAGLLLAVYAAATVIATTEKYLRGELNDLRIFRSSFFNLVAGRDLYTFHPGQYWDLFQYTPTFALLIAPFAGLPEFGSAIAWNLCNALALLAAIQFLNLEQQKRALVLWLIAIELLTSIENFQSNALVAALIIATYVAFERDCPVAAAIFVGLGASIKVFGGAAALLFVFYPHKGRFLIATAVTFILLAALPLLVTSYSQLQSQYSSWFRVLSLEYPSRKKLSVMNWLHAWFGVNWPNAIVQITGAFVLLVPLLFHHHYREAEFRLRFLASLLVFVVLFNHRAESPTFILAVTGIAIWYALKPRIHWRIGIMGLVVLATSLGSTDLVPRHLRETVTTPLVLKAVPCIIAWIAIQAELLGMV